MKLFLLLTAMLFSLSVVAHEDITKLETRCEVELKHEGIWWTQCPKGSITVGVDARVTSVPWVNVRVKCVTPIVVCKTIEVEPEFED